MTAASFLKQKLLERKVKNSAYSIRAFARDLGISSGRMVDLLNQKIPIGPRLATKFADRLKLSSEEGENFKKMAETDKEHRRQEGVFQKKILEEELALIVDSIHFDLLSLMETKNFKSDPLWMAARLGKNFAQVEVALENLMKLGLIAKSSSGKYSIQVASGTTTHNIPSMAIRQQHRNGLQEAIASLDKHSIDQRDFSSITMAVNTKKMEEAVKMITSFRRRLCRHLQVGPKTEVYTFKTAFFPKTENY